jgi:hypothetical protein
MANSHKILSSSPQLLNTNKYLISISRKELTVTLNLLATAFKSFNASCVFSNIPLLREYIASKVQVSSFDASNQASVLGHCVNHAKALLSQIRKSLNNPNVGSLTILYEADMPIHASVFIPVRSKSDQWELLLLFEKGDQKGFPLIITKERASYQFYEGKDLISRHYLWDGGCSIIQTSDNPLTPMKTFQLSDTNEQLQKVSRHYLIQERNYILRKDSELGNITYLIKIVPSEEQIYFRIYVPSFSKIRLSFAEFKLLSIEEIESLLQVFLDQFKLSATQLKEIIEFPFLIMGLNAQSL